jgi:tetratricopeptide (TPR) repeat protein
MRRPSRRTLLPASEVRAGRAALAEAYLRTGDYDAVDRLVERAAQAAGESGDRVLDADALALRGMVLHFRAIDLAPEDRAVIDPGPEQELFERSLVIRRELGDGEGVAESLFQLGLVYQVLRRDLEAGAPYVHEALAVVETVPDADVLLRSEIHRHVGFDTLLREERPDEAREQLAISLALRQSLAEQGWLASAHVALSLCERIAGRRAEAIVHARRAIAVVEAERLRERFHATGSDALAQAEALTSG